MSSTQEYHNVKWLLEVAKVAHASSIVDRVAKQQNINDLKLKIKDMEFETELLPYDQTV
jgi:hypothetical protein